MEYNSVLWNPDDSELIDLLERVQNNFLRCIYAPALGNNCDYWDRLEFFKLYSLQRRRERYMIIYTWKVIHNLYPNPGLHLNTTTEDHTAHPNRGIGINITNSEEIIVEHGPAPPDWLAGKSILQACCDLYNCLPRALRNMLQEDEEPGVLKFKTLLDEWLVKIPDRPNTPRRPKTARSNSIIYQKEYKKR